MNILIISNCPLESNQGSGYVICGFAEGMRKRGHSIRAYGPDDYILFPRIKRAKRIRVFAGYTFKAIGEAWKLGYQADIIELWGGVGWLACLVLTSWRPGQCKVISRSNGLEPHYRQISQRANRRLNLRRLLSHFESWTDGIGFSRADKLTVVSQYDEEFALKKGYQHRSNLVKLENSLPDDWLAQPSEKTEDEFSVGFVGSWLNNKGVRSLVEVIAKLDTMNSQCTWRIAGVGQEGKRELEERLGYSRLEVYPGLNRAELKDLYKEINVLLCLSTYESFGMVCSEAMALGCILLSTEVGFAYGLEKSCEYLSIEGDTAEQIAKKICQIKRNKDAYNEISRAGYERVQRLQWSYAINELDKHYKKLINQ